MADEKRNARRIPFRSEVECLVTGDSITHPEISDLSATGCFIDSTVEIPVGTRMTLKFPLPSGQTLKVDAEVVHSMPNFGMGVRFVDMGEEQRRAIESLIATS